LASWLATVRFMLVHRTEHNLNSAIPYTALSNGLIPLAPEAGNMSAVVNKAGVPSFSSTGIVDFLMYLREVEKLKFSHGFEKFKADHSISKMASCWSRILTSELKKARSS